jgi:hypothetical protein
LIFFVVVLGADGEEYHRDRGRVGEGCGGIWGGDTDQQRVLLLIQEYSLVILLVILQLILGLILSSWYFTRYGRSMAFLSPSMYCTVLLTQQGTMTATKHVS